MEESPRSSLRRPSRAPWIALGVAVLVAAGVAAWYWSARSPPQRQEAAPGAAAQPTAPEGTPGPDVDPATARALLDAISGNELVRKGLAEQDLFRRWAIVTDNIAEGASPRKQLQFLAPSGKFSVANRGGRTVIAEESYTRYDRFGDAVASVDVQAAARAYRGVRNTVETAYRALGYPQGSLDRVTVRALRRLAAAPVPDGDVEVVDEGGVYRFTDPKLEAASETEKHLLRMGPRNARLVQSKAKELLDALGLSSAAAGPEPGR